MRFEHAVFDRSRSVGLALKEMRMIAAGVPCTRCKREQARSLIGRQRVCGACAEALKIDRRVAAQKEERARMRSRG